MIAKLKAMILRRMSEIMKLDYLLQLIVHTDKRLTGEIDRLDGTQHGQLMVILELERQVSELKPHRDSKGRFARGVESIR